MLGNECSSPDIVAFFYNIYIFSTESNLPVTSTDAHLPRCSTWDLCLPPTSLCHPWNPSSPDLVEYCGLLERNWDDWWPGGWLLYIPTTGSSYPLCPDQDSHRTENRDMSGWASRSDVWEEHKSIWSCFVFGLLTPSVPPPLMQPMSLCWTSGQYG